MAIIANGFRKEYSMRQNRIGITLDFCKLASFHRMIWLLSEISSDKHFETFTHHTCKFRNALHNVVKLYVLVLVMILHVDLTRLASVSVTFNSRKITVVIGLAIIFLVILDLLVTRQILPYSTDVETTLFMLTVVVGYGLGSWILLGYTRKVSEEIRAKSRFINVLHWTVTITQFALLVILLVILFSGTKTGFLSSSVFAISSTLATFIMGVIAFKFFTWYKLS